MAVDWDVVEASWGQIWLRLDGNYSGKRYFDLQNQPTTTQGAYGIANARVGWKSSNDRLALTFGYATSPMRSTRPIRSMLRVVSGPFTTASVTRGPSAPL